MCIQVHLVNLPRALFSTSIPCLEYPAERWYSISSCIKVPRVPNFGYLRNPYTFKFSIFLRTSKIDNADRIKEVEGLSACEWACIRYYWYRGTSLRQSIFNS